MNGINRCGEPPSTSTSFAPGGEQMVDLAEHLARRAFEPRALRDPSNKTRPARNAGSRSRSTTISAPTHSRAPIAIVEAAQLRDHAAAVWLRPSSTSNGLIDAVPAQHPHAEARDVVAGLRVGLHFEPPFTPNTPLTRPRVTQLVGLRAHCGVAGRADALRRGGGAPGTA